MKKLDFGTYMHVGAIVENIEETIAKMEKIFDIETYRITDFPPKDMAPEDIRLCYRGEKNFFTARFCFMKMGHSEIELIQPCEGDSLWKEFLRENGEGIHHLKYEVDSMVDTVAFFKEQGIECLQYGEAVGPNKGKIWAYFDTTKELGYVVEILNRELGEVIE